MRNTNMFDTGQNVPSPMSEPPEKIGKNNGRKKPVGINDRRQTPGMGDYAATGNPHNTYWQSLEAVKSFSPPPPVMIPPAQVPSEMVQNVNLMTSALVDAIACTPLLVKKPYWMEPPSDAVMVDQTTIASGIAVPATGAWVDILRVVVPDRFYGVICGLGNMLEDEAQFVNVEWQVRINNAPLSFSMFDGTNVVPGVFRAQLGDPVDPTILRMPVIAKYKDTITLVARSLDAIAHTAYARMTGWMYAVRQIDGIGSEREGCQYTGTIPLMSGGGTGAPVY
jgi:hypothetical protein